MTDPQHYVDLSPFEGKTDEEVALLLGSRADKTWFYVDEIEQERSGYNDRVIAARNRERCEAGAQDKAPGALPSAGTRGRALVPAARSRPR